MAGTGMLKLVPHLQQELWMKVEVGEGGGPSLPSVHPPSSP